LFEAANFYEDHNSFTFLVLNNKVVCESAMLQLLGLQRTPNISDAIKSWRNARMLVSRSKTNKMDDIECQTEFEAIKKEFSKSRPKFDHALKWITTIADRFAERNASGDIVESDVLILPFQNLTSLFIEYEYRCSINYTPVELRASKTTFFEAFKSQTKIRMARCKGSFNTCEVCNNLHDLSRDSNHRWNAAQHEVILELQRLHWTQQELERKELDKNIRYCQQLHEGQPKGMLISY
jgi:hypothetical protein